MNRRNVVLFVVLAAVAALSMPASAQAPQGTQKAAGSANWTHPRTAWGDPDLGGMWRGFTGIPLERPNRFKGREFLTDEEIAAKRKAQADFQERKRQGISYEHFFRNQANYNNIFAYDEALGPVSKRTSGIVDPPDGRLPPLTPQALERWEAREATSHGRGEADSYIDRTLGERCINVLTLGRVGNWGLGDPAVDNPARRNELAESKIVGADTGGMYEAESGRPSRRLLQSPGYVVIVSGTDSVTSFGSDEYRIVPVDGRAPLPGVIRQFQGDSRGRWEGNTLVVETKNLNDPDPMLTAYGSSVYPGTRETLRIVERFTRVGPNVMEYRYTIDDPAVYTRPYTVLEEYTLENNHVMAPSLCHENNKDLPMQLSSGRQDEASNLDFGTESMRARLERLKDLKAERAAAGQGR